MEPPSTYLGPPGFMHGTLGFLAWNPRVSCTEPSGLMHRTPESHAWNARVSCMEPSGIFAGPSGTFVGPSGTFVGPASLIGPHLSSQGAARGHAKFLYGSMSYAIHEKNVQHLG